MQPTTPTTPAHGAIRSQGFGTDLSNLTLGNGSLLGRRKAPDSMADWSPPTKARLRTYASDVAGEYGVPESRRDEFLDASALPTHKLVMITLAAVLGRQDEADIEAKLQTYLVSTEFKDNVISKIRGVLLDPRLPSYKTGFLDRLLRHIRLNPGTYRIPPEFRNLVTTRAFNSAVSKAATTSRAEMKRKMATAWTARTTIYDLVKALAWKSSQEMTDDIWGRFAWVQLQLVDYKSEGGKDDGAWDHIDKLLAERRATALQIPIENRAAFSSFVFEEALKLHNTECKPKTKKKSSTQLPQWQRDISRAVEEMESYTQEDLAEEEDLQDENDDEPTPGSPARLD